MFRNLTALVVAIALAPVGLYAAEPNHPSKGSGSASKGSSMKSGSMGNYNRGSNRSFDHNYTRISAPSSPTGTSTKAGSLQLVVPHLAF